MKPRLVAFDLDGTLLTCNCSLSFCRYLAQKKVFSFFQLFFCGCCYFIHKKKFLSLAALHKIVFRMLFRGKALAPLQFHLENFLEDLIKKSLFEPLLDLLKKSLKKGDDVILLSSSPSFLVARIAEKLNIPSAHGTKVTVDSEGSLWNIETIMDGKAKADYLKMLNSSFLTVAYTDSILDLPFLEAADIAIAVRPDKHLRKVALQRGWEVIP